MSWILTASVPGDDRVFTIGSKADYPEPGPWIARLASPILSLRAVFVTPGQPQCLSTGSSHIWCDIFHSPFACFLRGFRNMPLVLQPEARERKIEGRVARSVVR